MRERDVCKRRTACRAAALLCAAGALGAGSVLAQQEQAPVAPDEPVQSDEAANRALEEARRELEAAQRTVEEAARATAEREREAAREERARAVAERERQREAALEAAREERARASAEREREREAAREERSGELERARRELEAARRNLEQAAREVAQLSARAVAPIVEDFQVQWLGAGQRAVLGLVVEDAADGARVTAVSPGGPADEAGVETDDVIVSIDGRALAEPGRTPSRVLIERLSDVEPGAAVALRVRRDGVPRDIDVETREREDRILSFEGPSIQRFTNLFRRGRWSSMELVSLTPELGDYFGTDRGLLVVRAPEDESLLLQDGDVILDIGGREPNSPEHAMRILGTFEPGETVELTIMRRRQRQTLEIPLAEEESGGADGPA